MPKDDLQSLDTSGVADGFNKFLEAQGLGDMNPSVSGRFKQGVEVSPMDEILALNGIDLDELFVKRLPPLPSPSLTDSNPSDSTSADSSAGSSAKEAIDALSLSNSETETLGRLVSSGGAIGVQNLPAEISQLVLATGPKNTLELVSAIVDLHSLLGDRPLPANASIAEVMLDLMKRYGSKDASALLATLKDNPALLNPSLKDPLTGIDSPLGATTYLLDADTSRATDELIGDTSDQTLLASSSGGSTLIGGGGADLYVVPISNSPFLPVTTISDFNQSLGSKLVIDTTGYQGRLAPKLRYARDFKSFKRASASKYDLIFSEKSATLFFNGNGTRRGLGGVTGGPLAYFANGSAISTSDVYIFQGGQLLALDGSPIF
jgi:hypothetical protein